jgi:hypothetical protein
VQSGLGCTAAQQQRPFFKHCAPNWKGANHDLWLLRPIVCAASSPQARAETRRTCSTAARPKAHISQVLDSGSGTGGKTLVQTVWSNLPLEKHQEVRARGNIDMNQLLPSDRRCFAYMGSLTTPTCSEGVLWVVLGNPVALSAEQIEISSRTYPMNARPVQSASGQRIMQLN